MGAHHKTSYPTDQKSAPVTTQKPTNKYTKPGPNSQHRCAVSDYYLNKEKKSTWCPEDGVCRQPQTCPAPIYWVHSSLHVPSWNKISIKSRGFLCASFWRNGVTTSNLLGSTWNKSLGANEHWTRSCLCLPFSFYSSLWTPPHFIRLPIPGAAHYPFPGQAGGTSKTSADKVLLLSWTHILRLNISSRARYIYFSCIIFVLPAVSMNTAQTAHPSIEDYRSMAVSTLVTEWDWKLFSVSNLLFIVSVQLKSINSY